MRPFTDFKFSSAAFTAAPKAAGISPWPWWPTAAPEIRAQLGKEESGAAVRIKVNTRKKGLTGLDNRIRDITREWGEKNAKRDAAT